MARRTKKLLTMNTRNRDILEVSAPSSNSRTKEQRIRKRPSKLHGMTLRIRKGRGVTRSGQPLLHDF